MKAWNPFAEGIPEGQPGNTWGVFKRLNLTEECLDLKFNFEGK